MSLQKALDSPGYKCQNLSCVTIICNLRITHCAIRLHNPVSNLPYVIPVPPKLKGQRNYSPWPGAVEIIYDRSLCLLHSRPLLVFENDVLDRDIVLPVRSEDKLSIRACSSQVEKRIVIPSGLA